MKKIIAITSVIIALATVSFNFVKAATLTCTDTDSGYKAYYYIKGFTKVGNKKIDDKCINRTTLRERLCQNNGTASVDFNCPNGCKKGACSKSPICTDSDSGYKAYYYIKGFTKADNKKTNDKCMNSTTLREGLCQNNKAVRVNFNCPNGCKGGVCL